MINEAESNPLEDPRSALVGGESAPSRTPEVDSFMAFQSAKPPASGAGCGWTGPPPTIPGFRIQAIAGSGGMGVVFRAEQLHPRRTVAIKVIRPALVADVRWEREVLDRFASEVANAARLQHPYILPIHAAGSFQDGPRTLPYLIMEFLAEPTLLEYADLHGLDRDGRLELLAKVADGVAYLHINDITHGDLKPSNIAVRKNGFPAIRDFSLATNGVGQSPSDRRYTAPERLAGTHGYFAPEQLAGTVASARVADVYTLGVDGYLLLMGTPPPGSPDASRIEIARRHGGDCAAVLGRALEHDPGARYQSAQSFADDLRAVIRGDRPGVVSRTLTDDLRRLVRHHRKAVATALSLALLVIAGTATTAWQASIARANEAKAAQRGERLASLANTAVTKLAGILERLPSGWLEREGLLKESLSALESMAEEASGDRELLELLGRTFAELAGSVGDPARSNRGDLANAARIAQRAIDTWALIPPESRSPSLLREISATHVARSRMLSESDPPQSLAELWLAYESTTRLLEVAPEFKRARLDVAYALFLAAKGASDDETLRSRLRSELGRCAALLRTCCGAFPGEREELLNDADAFESLAQVAGSLDQFAEARRLLADSAAMLQPMLDLEVRIAYLREPNLSRCEAMILEREGRVDDAWELRRSVVDRYRELNDRFPVDLNMRESLSWSTYEFAELAVRLGRDADAATNLSLSDRRERYAADPADNRLRVGLMKSIELRLAWLPPDAMEERRQLEGELQQLDRALATSSDPVTSQSPP